MRLKRWIAARVEPILDRLWYKLASKIFPADNSDS